MERRTEEMANRLKPQPSTNSVPSMFDGLQGRTKELVKDLRFAKEGKPQPSITEVYQQLKKKMESLEIINQQNRIVREEEGL